MAEAQYAAAHIEANGKDKRAKRSDCKTDRCITRSKSIDKALCRIARCKIAARINHAEHTEHNQRGNRHYKIKNSAFCRCKIQFFKIIADSICMHFVFFHRTDIHIPDDN